MDTKTPNNNIEFLLERKGMTVTALAKAVGVTRQYMSELKNSSDRSQLNWNMMVKLAQVLDCRPEDIISTHRPPLSAQEKTGHHTAFHAPAQLSDAIVDQSFSQHYVDASLLAEAIECVKQAAAEQGKMLTDEQLAIAAANTYSEAQKFAEKPSRSMASMAIKLLDKGRDNGREMEA